MWYRTQAIWHQSKTNKPRDPYVYISIDMVPRLFKPKCNEVPHTSKMAPKRTHKAKGSVRIPKYRHGTPFQLTLMLILGRFTYK